MTGIAPGREDCGCACHRMPGVHHVVACCSAPTYAMKHTERPGMDERLKTELVAHGIDHETADELIAYSYARAERIRAARAARQGTLWLDLFTREDVVMLRTLVAQWLVATRGVSSVPPAVAEHSAVPISYEKLWPLHTLFSEALIELDRRAVSAEIEEAESIPVTVNGRVLTDEDIERLADEAVQDQDQSVKTEQDGPSSS